MENSTFLFSTDPYLAYQPAFSKSLPVQLFVNGVTLTLLVVLLFHLLCECLILRQFLQHHLVASLPVLVMPGQF